MRSQRCRQRNHDQPCTLHQQPQHALRGKSLPGHNRPGHTGSVLSAVLMAGFETSTYGRFSGVHRGTPAYMAPETLKGQSADVRSDIYSLGCVLHEIATGSRPQTQALKPAGLERVVRTCLADDPDQRWQTAREVKVALGMIQQSAPAARQQRPWFWFGVSAVLIAVAMFAGWLTRRPEQPRTGRCDRAGRDTRGASVALHPER
jgi:serine/threonine protein kinase